MRRLSERAEAAIRNARDTAGGLYLDVEFPLYELHREGLSTAKLQPAYLSPRGKQARRRLDAGQALDLDTL